MATLAPKVPQVFDSAALEQASALGRRNIEPYARARLETYHEYLKGVRLVPLPREEGTKPPAAESNQENAK